MKKAGKSASPSASSSASATDPGDAKAPEFDFPKGVKVVIADEMTGERVKDEVLRDHAYSLKATILAYAKGDPELPLAYRYLQDSAGDTVRVTVRRVRKSGQTVTGTYRYFNRTVTMKGKQGAVVRICENARDAFGKDVKTGKVLRNQPSVKDFTSARHIMQKRGGVWRVVSAAGKTGDRKCVQ